MKRGNYFISESLDSKIWSYILPLTSKFWYEKVGLLWSVSKRWSLRISCRERYRSSKNQFSLWVGVQSESLIWSLFICFIAKFIKNLVLHSKFSKWRHSCFRREFFRLFSFQWERYWRMSWIIIFDLINFSYKTPRYIVLCFLWDWYHSFLQIQRDIDFALTKSEGFLHLRPRFIDFWPPLF